MATRPAGDHRPGRSSTDTHNPVRRSRAAITEVDVNAALVRIDGSTLTGPPPGQTLRRAGDHHLELRGQRPDRHRVPDAGISISGPGSQGNWLWGNFLGALPDPTNGKNFEVDRWPPPALSAPDRQPGEGVRITSSNNRIGGDTPGLPNVMANNGYDASGNSSAASAS